MPLTMSDALSIVPLRQVITAAPPVHDLRQQRQHGHSRTGEEDHRGAVDRPGGRSQTLPERKLAGTPSGGLNRPDRRGGPRRLRSSRHRNQDVKPVT